MHKFADGKLFDNADISVTAVRAHHMPKKHFEYMSYSFRIECEGKTVVFSGDMRIEDIDDILPDRCDAFLVETGHHQIEDICEQINRKMKKVDTLLFIHHGGYIMRDTDGASARANAAFNGKVLICRDGYSYKI